MANEAKLLQVLPNSVLVIADSTTLSGNARVALFVLIGVLLVILGILIAFALLIRRTNEDEVVEEEFPVSVGAPIEEVQEELVMMATSVADTARAGSALAVASASVVTCPTCRREYDTPLEFCPHDARRLIPTSQLIATARESGSVCPSCRRGFESGVKFCPHDATALVPTAMDRARRELIRPKDTGVVAKICPECNERHDLAVTFCPTDGAELVTLN